jgi:hypothetical protein
MARITAANASKMAARSWEVRRERENMQGDSSAIPQQIPLPASDYVAFSVTRTRGQLDRLHAMLAKSKDAQEIERLARSIASLSELERVLSGRPLPGSRRPGKESPKPMFGGGLAD